MLRKKEFDYDDTIRTRITNLRTQGKKFKDWVVETKDISDGDLGEIEFELMLQLAKKEKWFTDTISKFQKKTSSYAHGTLEHWNNVRVFPMTKSTLKIIIGVPLHVELLYGHIESVLWR